MLRLVKQLTVITIAVAVLMGTSAFAQNDSDNSGAVLVAKAPAPPAKPAPRMATVPKPKPSAPPANYSTRTFEFTLQGGGVFGGNSGLMDLGACRDTVANGCNVNQPLDHNNTPVDGIYPGRLGGIRNFQRFGGLTPGNGGFVGIRAGWNFHSDWQLEFIYNHLQADTSFSNENQLNQAVANFDAAGFGGNPRTGNNLDNLTGKPQGNQNMWLFNLNRNFNVGSRVVPYIGIGVGAEQWLANPNWAFRTNTEARNTANGSIADFTRTTRGGTGFAWDVAAGLKVHVTERFGIRADFMNVMSFPTITSNFSAIDVNGVSGTPGAILPMAGSVQQHGRFNQALVSGGVFWTMGQALSSSTGSSSTGDREGMHDRWEISFNYGAVRGSSLGKANQSCTEAVAGGCDLNQDLSTEGGLGVFPTKISAPLPNFMVNGGIRPGDGWTSGLRLGFNWTPNWQLEFMWNILGTGTAFTNKDELDLAEVAFFSGRSDSPKSWIYGKNGRAQGNQQQYLFNINYNFQPERKLVPYIGAGLGAVRFYNQPGVGIVTDNSAGNGGIAAFSKTVSGNTGFAFDLAAGLKYHWSRHWGLRADVTNVVSWQEFKHTFQTTDVSDFLGTGAGAIVPVSGFSKQSNSFNQLSGTAGVFFNF